MSIHLHIEQLVVRGLPLTATDRAELASALQIELIRLLASEDGARLWAESSARPRLEAGSIRYQPGSSPIGLGKAVAESLFQSLQSNPPTRRGMA